jgi:predicted dehydrogenase
MSSRASSSDVSAADRPALRIALIGTGFMGRAHSQAWRTAAPFFDLPLVPVMTTVVGRDPQRTEDFARTWGWQNWSTRWREVVESDDIDAVDIVAPGDVHAEIAEAALAAGKHVLCEKPLASSLDDAARMAAAAAAHPDLVAACGFSYRRTPALAAARELIARGRLGAIRHVRAQYLQDWLSDADAPFTWRLDRAVAGSGALGDIGAHSIDTAQWLTGASIASVSATVRTFVPTRPDRAEVVGLGGRAADGADRREVTVDDAAAFTAEFDDGALGVFECTRMALGRRNANRIEVNGERGSIAFDFERMNEFEFYDADDARGEQGFRRVQATEPEHPYAAAWWPVGHGLGYEHTFTHEVVDLVRAIGGQGRIEPDFAQALQVQHVLDAVERSAADDGRRTAVRRTEGTR